MDDTDEDYPKSVDFLPNEEVELSYLRALQQQSTISRIWIPRFPSLEHVDSDQDDVWDLSIGIIPTSGIDKFIVQQNGQIFSLEFAEDGWQTNEPTDRDDIHAQVFAYQIKPYVEIQRAIHARERDERSS